VIELHLRVMTELWFRSEVKLYFHANPTPLCKTTTENHVTKTA